MITDQSLTFCFWCGHLATPEASSITLCGLTCRDQDCLQEHARECETCLSKSSLLPGVGMVTHLFWECRCEEEYIHPYHDLDCPACNTCRDDGMPAYVRDVLIFAHEWRLEAALVARLREEFPDTWEFEPGQSTLFFRTEQFSITGGNDFLLKRTPPHAPGA